VELLDGLKRREWARVCLRVRTTARQPRLRAGAHTTIAFGSGIQSDCYGVPPGASRGRYGGAAVGCLVFFGLTGWFKFSLDTSCVGPAEPDERAPLALTGTALVGWSCYVIVWHIRATAGWVRH
jgi:hypothetical protein